MKKGVKYLGALLLGLFLLTGCKMETNIGMVITDEGKVSLEMIQTMDDEMIDTMLDMNGSMDLSGDDTEGENKKAHTDEERWAYLEKKDEEDENEDKDVKKERYSADGMKGIKSTKGEKNIEEISSSSADSRINIMEDDATEKVLFIKDGNKYKSNMKVQDAAGEAKSYMSMGGTFEYYFTITLPTKPTSHNADKVSNDGKTLKWDILEDKDIEFEFELSEKKESKSDDKKDKDDDKDKIMLYCIIGGAALLVIILIVVIIVVCSSKKKNNTQQNVEQQNNIQQ